MWSAQCQGLRRRQYRTEHRQRTHPTPGQEWKFLTPPGIEPGPPGWKAEALPTTPRRPTWLLFNLIRGATAPKSQGRLKGLLIDGSTGRLVVCKAISLNLNFSFLNRISLLLTSSSYQIFLTKLGGHRSRPYTSRKILGYTREWNPDLLDGNQTC